MLHNSHNPSLLWLVVLWQKGSTEPNMFTVL